MWLEVRNIVGALVRVGYGELTEEEMIEALSVSELPRITFPFQHNLLNPVLVINTISACGGTTHPQSDLYVQPF